MPEPELLQASIAAAARDLGAMANFDVGRCFDPASEPGGGYDRVLARDRL